MSFDYDLPDDFVKALEEQVLSLRAYADLLGLQLLEGLVEVLF